VSKNKHQAILNLLAYTSNLETKGMGKSRKCSTSMV